MKLNFSIATIITTTGCNLNCRYCFVNQTCERMSLDTFKKIVDNLNDGTDAHKQINFFGGEPLLEWKDLIEPGVIYAEEQIKNVSFSITTNGTLLNSDIVDFMGEHNFEMILSLDGIRECQDFNRKTHDGHGTFDVVDGKVIDIIKVLPSTVMRGTITANTAKHLFENIVYSGLKGFSSCFFCPNNLEEWSVGKADLNRQVRKYTMHFIDCYRKDKRPIQFAPYITTINSILNNKRETNCIDCSNCGVGGESLSFAPDGSIYTCQQMGTYKDSIYRIGDLESGVDDDKLKSIVERYKKEIAEVPNSKDECESCIVRNGCTEHYCHANSYIKHKDLKHKASIECYWESLLYSEAFIAIYILSANDNELFKKDFGLE